METRQKPISFVIVTITLLVVYCGSYFLLSRMAIKNSQGRSWAFFGTQQDFIGGCLVFYSPKKPGIEKVFAIIYWPLLKIDDYHVLASKEFIPRYIFPL